MDASTKNELRLLRARAYGPASDIHDDPGAVARLDELERLAREPLAPPAAAEPAPEPEPEPTVAARAVAPASPARQARLTARQRAWWAGSLLGSAAIGCLIAGVGALLATVGSPVHQVADLAVDESADAPPYFEQPYRNPAVFDEFFELRPVRLVGPVGGGQEGKCLAIVAASDVTDPDELNPGVFGFTCGVEPFGATAPLLVDERLPAALREQFSDGTALQFELRGDRVRVYSDAG